jgi:hypothetical protein
LFAYSCDFQQIRLILLFLIASGGFPAIGLSLWEGGALNLIRVIVN